MVFFEGIIFVVIMFFDVGDDVDVVGLWSNVDALIDVGVYGFVVVGMMGEVGLLIGVECEVVVRVVIEVFVGCVLVIVGILFSLVK